MYDLLIQLFFQLNPEFGEGLIGLVLKELTEMGRIVEAKAIGYLF